MRRLFVILLALCGLAVPATAAAHVLGASDGTIVVRGADNGDGAVQGARPVISLLINGFAIGRVAGAGRIEIYDLDPANDSAPEVTGADTHKDVTRTFGDQTLTGTRWSGTTFSFRAADGMYRIVIYGSGVYLFSGGTGKVSFTGNPDAPDSDGTYSLNGGAWHSLVDTAKPILVASNG